MKRTLLSWIFLSLLLAGASACFSQLNTSAFYIKTYMAVNGLPDSYTLDVFQDKQKYIWIGTYSGLSRFDGKTFANFGIKNGFTDLYINAIIQDDENRIWLGSRKGIGYFQNERFHPTSVSDGAKIDFIYSFGKVVHQKIWAFTSKGLYELNGNIWVKKTPIPGYENTACIYAVEKGDAIYYCYPGNIIKVSADGRSQPIESGKVIASRYTRLRRYNERLLVSTENGFFEVIDDRLFPIFEKQTTNKTIYSFFMDSQQRIWLSTEEDGLMVAAPGNVSKFEFKVPLRSQLISSFYEDEEKNIWLANFQGLVKAKNSFFDIFTPVHDQSPSQYFNIVPHGNKVFVCGNINGLYQLENQNLIPKKFLFENNFLSRDARAALLDGLCIDQLNNFWAVTRSRQIVKITPDGRQQLISLPGKTDSAYSFYHVTSDPATGRIFFSGDHLYVYANNSFSEVIPKNTRQPIENVSRSLVLKNGEVLVNSSSSGIWLLTKNGYAYQISEKTAIPYSSRLIFTEDLLGNIWLSYPGGGLIRYYWQNRVTLKKKIELSAANALPNDVVEAMTVDGSNRLWAATLSGVVVIDSVAADTDTNYFTYKIGQEQGLNFDISSGLTRLVTDSKGDIWFSSNNIVIRFRTNELISRASSPVTHIESLQLNMKETDWSNWADSLAGPFMLPRQLQLPYDKNSLTFNFKGLNFEADDDSWYSHRLVGIDNRWTSAYKNNSVSFMGLSPGKFIFMVKSRRTNSKWSEPVQISFVIAPPFWQTWWFRVLGILFASMVLVFIFRTQLKRVSKKAAIENQLRNLEMKALKAQMNPHFIYNALNSIQSLVIDGKKQQALDYMVKFSRLLRQVLNHSEQTVVKLEQELDTLALYIQLESLRLNYELEYSITLDENILPENEMIPPLILQPFAENALWHGLSSKMGDKRLSIRIWCDDSWLYSEVEDNGVGRVRIESQKNTLAAEGPRGLEITRSRLQIYNEVVSLNPIRFKDLVMANGTPAGTAVTLIIRRK
jgi:ligand-binding sensor domain-containing protein